MNLLLWQRARSATGRDLTFFSVGVTFRAGPPLLILGGGIYTALVSPALLPLTWLYFAFGLTAVSLARIGEKAAEAQSTGDILPPRRMAQVIAAVGGTVILLAALTLAYTPQALHRALRIFDPLWVLLRPLLLAALMLLVRVLEPFLTWLEEIVTRLMRASLGDQGAAPAAQGAGQRPDPLSNIPSWPIDLIRNAIVVFVIVVVVIGVLGFLLLYLERVRKAVGIDEGEEEDTEQATYGGGILRRGLDGLRRAARLAGRFGMSRELLAAISVENIYANLCRIAWQRGHARLPSQPPDAYLPILLRAFPDADERLRRITNAYMRVHYGDHPVTRSSWPRCVRTIVRCARQSRRTGHRIARISRSIRISRSGGRSGQVILCPGEYFRCNCSGAGRVRRARAARAADRGLARYIRDGRALRDVSRVRVDRGRVGGDALAGSTLPPLAGWLFVVGTVLFSFSLYALALTGQRWLGAITPLGGVAFIAGWLCLAVAALRS